MDDLRIYDIEHIMKEWVLEQSCMDLQPLSSRGNVVVSLMDGVYLMHYSVEE